MTQAIGSGLILAARVGKHTDEFIQELIVNTEGKTGCQQWCTDGWGGYQRVLGDEVSHIVGKEKTRAVRAYQWYCEAANRSMASSSE